MTTVRGRQDEVDICNLALTHLGLPAISESEFLTPSTKQSIVMKRYFRSTRDALLREHPWKHATLNIALTIAAGVTVEGWDYIYEYPVAVASGGEAGAQLIRNIFIDVTVKNPPPIEYKLFHDMIVATGGQTVIATNSADAYAEITVMGVDKISEVTPAFPGQWVNTYDALFNMAWSYLMAASAAIILTGDKSKAEDMARWHAVYLDKAKLADVRETNIDTYDARHTSAFVDAR